MVWQPHARRLAGDLFDTHSRWHDPVTTTPRHVFVPRWWDGQTLRDGPSDPAAWMEAAYSDTSLVTRRGPLHADHARLDDEPAGLPTSSSTLPGLVVKMYRHARLYTGADVLDVATGSGYGCALLAKRFGDEHVTSIDVDAYLTEAAAERLDSVDLHPKVVTCDATGPLPGSYDRIVAMVGMPTVPASWMEALRPGGRLVTVIADTSLIITATKQDDGWAHGQVEWDRAMFMSTRSGPDFEPSPDLAPVADAEGDVTRGRYPVVSVMEAWDLHSVLEVAAPGVVHGYGEDDDGTRTALMAHADGSWARAVGHGTDPPTVHQGGPRRLWDILDELRDEWLAQGYFQLFGAQAWIPPEGGVIHLVRGKWKATIGHDLP